MKQAACVLATLLLCTATAAAQFTFVLTERTSGSVSITRGFEDGAKFRLEFQESQIAENPKGMYAISVDSGRTIFLVNPVRKEFARIDSQTLMAKAMEELKARMTQANLQLESPKVETLLSEPGEVLDGHPTRHYKLRISYSLYFVKTDLRSSYVEYQDLWMASDIEQQGASNLLISFRLSGDVRIDGAWQRELAQIPGFPLRQVTLRTEVNEDGNSTVLRTLRDIKAVQSGPVPESLFVLPIGYKEVAAKPQSR